MSVGGPTKQRLSCGVPAAILLTFLLFDCDSLPEIDYSLAAFTSNGESDFNSITTSFGSSSIKQN